jgi:hypothetical protein
METPWRRGAEPWKVEKLARVLGARKLEPDLMLRSTLFGIAAPAALAFSCATLYAQAPAEPTAYTVTVEFHITGLAVRTTYRLGSRVLVDAVPSPGIPPSTTPGAPTRILYSLDTGQSLSWDPANAATACKAGSFQGDEWLDPFSGAADLAKTGVTEVGSENIHGIPAKILVSKAKPAIRLWVDPKTGLMLKAEFTPPSSEKSIPYFEVTEVRLEPPPAALFEIPAHCAPDPEAPKSRRQTN